MSIPVIPPFDAEGTSFRFREMKASQYGGLVNFCGWREILNQMTAGRRKITLPPYAGSLTGTVAHNLLEQVIKNRIRDDAEFEGAWEHQINAKSAQLQADYPWMSPRPPLVDYEKKFRTKLMAQKIWQRRTSGQGTGSIPEGEEEYHVDGLTGRIDLVIKRDDFTAIADYTTGTITEEDGGIKPAFVIQLKLYAVLYQKQTSRLVNRLTLLNLAGERYEVPFTQAELEPLYQQVLAKAAMLNQLIETGDFFNLANLEAETCNFCQLRPVCDFYWSSAIKNKSDFEGRFQEAKLALDQTLLLVFDVNGERRLLKGLKGQTINDFAGKEGITLRVLNAWPSDKPGMAGYYHAGVHTALFWRPDGL
jgi:CRISPR/Cas system-associated exonuclease Cas4 (RecB family)